MTIKKRKTTPKDARALGWPSYPVISPDGKWVVYVVRRPDPKADKFVSAIWIAPLDCSSPPRVFASSANVQGPQWSPSGDALAYLSNAGKGSQIMVAPLAGGEPKQLTQTADSSQELRWSPDGKQLAFVRAVGGRKKDVDDEERKNAPLVITDIYYKSDGAGLRGDGRRHVFVIDVTTGNERQITHGDWHDAEPHWSPDGKQLVFISERGRQRWNRHARSALWLVSARGGRPRRLTPDAGNVAGPRFAPDGRHIAYTGRAIGGSSYRNHSVMIVNVRGAPKPRSLTGGIDMTVGNMTRSGSHIEWHPSGESLVFMGLERGSALIWSCNVRSGALSPVIAGDVQASAIAVTSDGKQVVYLGAWSSSLPELYAVDLRSRTPRRITDVNAELTSALNLVAAQRMSYASDDGLTIEAFVLYPPGYQKKRRYPLIVSIHGGPHGNHPSIFNPLEAQIYAAAGYVVLLPNPRGSVSYGEAFASACIRDWGGGDYRDIIAGVDVLIANGSVDPDQLYVEGYSYGGYMAAWIVTQTNRFRAAVAGAPVTDLVSAFGTDDILHTSIESMGGSPFDLLEDYYGRSPYVLVKNVNTPVLLTHWEGDLRDPIAQSEQFFKGLKYFGKEAEFVRYPGGAHGIRTPSQAIDLIERTLEWCARHSGRASR